MPKNKYLALKLGIQTYQIFTNDDVCIPMGYLHQGEIKRALLHDIQHTLYATLSRRWVCIPIKPKRQNLVISDYMQQLDNIANSKKFPFFL